MMNNKKYHLVFEMGSKRIEKYGISEAEVREFIGLVEGLEGDHSLEVKEIKEIEEEER